MNPMCKTRQRLHGYILCEGPHERQGTELKTLKPLDNRPRIYRQKVIYLKR